MSARVAEMLEVVKEAQLTGEELRLLTAQLLNLIPPGRFGQALVEAIRAKTYSISFEAVLLRERAGQLEVLLQQRPKEDRYSLLWHCPGTTFEVGETPAMVAKRVGPQKFGVPLRSYRQVGKYWSPQEPSSIGGSYLALVHLVELEGEPKGGVWRPVEALPEKTVATHRDIVAMAAKAYRRP